MGEKKQNLNSDIKVIDGGITATEGFLASGIACGIKQSGKKDLAIIYSDNPCKVAGLFTTNTVVAAPVKVSKNHISSGEIKAIVVNSGNANCCTGIAGLENAISMAQIAGAGIGIDPHQVLVASTGIIGIPLPMSKIEEGIKEGIANLSPQGSSDAAQAIQTTDTFSKEIAVQITISGKPIVIGGIAKGAGMICPHLATMLAFITTDAMVENPLLQKMLNAAVNKSFNMITVDGQLSTNDMVVLMANSTKGQAAILEGSLDAVLFQKALDKVTEYLAKMIVKDGEGATKFIEIEIKGAVNNEEAKQVAMTIANSNLVKTAFFGEDANWGRIIAAIGSSTAKVNPEKIDIYLGSEKVVGAGEGILFCVETLNKVLKEKEIKMVIDLRLGDRSTKVWTADLSYDYVKLNAHYKT